MKERIAEEIRSIVRKIAEAERQGGGFRMYFETAERELMRLVEKPMVEEKRKPIFDQTWSVRFTDDDVLLIGEDDSTIARLARPDHGSDLALAGYIVGLQIRARRGSTP